MVAAASALGGNTWDGALVLLAAPGVPDAPGAPDAPDTAPGAAWDTVFEARMRSGAADVAVFPAVAVAGCTCVVAATDGGDLEVWRIAGDTIVRVASAGQHDGGIHCVSVAPVDGAVISASADAR